MPKIAYKEQRFSSKVQTIIDQANDIIDEYALQGYDLTLRQLYYQFVSRDLLQNTHQEYKRLGSIINDARLAGQIDWDKITDRTRNLHRLSHWDSEEDIISACAGSYHVDFWSNQLYRPEIWIEKEALAGVFQRVCDELDVPFFSCRGYTSQSEMWGAAMRLKGWVLQKQKPIILHFGDHDPSGQDMTRDIRDRLKLFMGGVQLERLALNMDQVEQYEPPPNPTKMTDVRADGYVAEFGDESWELDALEPAVLAELVSARIKELRDEKAWKKKEKEKKTARENLTKTAEAWDDIVAWMKGRK